MEKTNAIRALEQEGLTFDILTYEVDPEDLSAGTVALKCGIEPERVYKTLVLSSERQDVFVCIIPGDQELDLKKAARAVGAKRVELVAMKQLLQLTGYVRGGCSPIGMKKSYRTFIEESCLLYQSICISGGRRGLQVLLDPRELIRTTGAELTDLI